jgi:hypothetical protein
MFDDISGELACKFELTSRNPNSKVEDWIQLGDMCHENVIPLNIWELSSVNTHTHTQKQANKQTNHYLNKKWDEV